MKFYTQKMVALYHTGIESWLDWKRAGKPSFIQTGSEQQTMKVKYETDHVPKPRTIR
jgi:hypothetical protein